MSKLWNRSIVTKDGKTIELQAQHQFGSGDSLEDLEDVDITNPQIGQVIKWDGQKWVNANESGGGGQYILPVASSEVLGGIKVGSNLSIDENGVLSAPAPTPQYTLPTASDEVLGGVKVGSNLSIDENGVLSASGGSQYELPKASGSTLGGIKVGSRLTIDNDGTLSANDQSYTLPKAAAGTLGGVKVGSGLSIDNDGVLSATGGGGGNTHEYVEVVSDGTETWTDYLVQLLDLVDFTKVTPWSKLQIIIPYDDPNWDVSWGLTTTWTISVLTQFPYNNGTAKELKALATPSGSDFDNYNYLLVDIMGPSSSYVQILKDGQDCSSDTVDNGITFRLYYS